MSSGRGKKRIITRTGCATWIRKVKCDEGKPACQKCLSTGRVCDGYSALFRSFQAATPQQNAVCRAPKVQRILALDIDGTDTERQFFRTCKIATEAGVALHLHNVSSFWMAWAPRLAHHDDAMKHALVALGAAYHLTKVMDTDARSAMRLRPRMELQYPIYKLEKFIMQQYTLAIGKLRGWISSTDPDGTFVALACCLVFTCIENLRFNHRGAMVHFRHGVRIIQNSFDVGHYYHQYFLSSSPPAAKTRPPGRLVSGEEIWSMINTFRQLEISENFFSRDVPLALSHLVSASWPEDDGSDLPEQFNTLEEGYKARVKLNIDVLAFNWEVSQHCLEPEFWDAPDLWRRHLVLQRRAVAIQHKYDAYLAGRWANELGTRECASCWLDMLQIRSMQVMLEIMPVRRPGFPHASPDAVIEKLLDFMERANHAMTAYIDKSSAPLDFTTDGTVVPPIYLLYKNATNAKQRSRALALLEQYRIVEGPWDARLLAKFLRSSQTLEKTGRTPLQGSVPLYNRVQALDLCATVPRLDMYD